MCALSRAMHVIDAWLVQHLPAMGGGWFPMPVPCLCPARHPNGSSTPEPEGVLGLRQLRRFRVRHAVLRGAGETPELQPQRNRAPVARRRCRPLRQPARPSAVLPVGPRGVEGRSGRVREIPFRARFQGAAREKVGSSIRKFDTRPLGRRASQGLTAWAH